MYPGGPTPGGTIWTNVTSPSQGLTVATDTAARSMKEGRSSATAWLGLFAFGDGSVDAAMKSGGITKVHHVDHQVTHLFAGGIFLTNTTIVHGE